MNPKYDPETDDTIRGKERIIFPRKGEARWWAECFGRTDEEMNVFGPQAPPNLTPQTSNTSNARSGTTTPIPEEPVVTGIETADGAIGVGTTAHLPPTHAIGDRSPKLASAPKPFDAAATLGQDLRQGVMASFEKLGITGNANRAVSPAAESNRPSEDDVAREAVKPSPQLGVNVSEDQKAKDATKSEDVSTVQPVEKSADIDADTSVEQAIEKEAAQDTSLGLEVEVVEKKAENRSRSRKPSHNPEAKKDMVEMEMQ